MTVSETIAGFFERIGSQRIGLLAIVGLVGLGSAIRVETTDAPLFFLTPDVYAGVMYLLVGGLAVGLYLKYWMQKNGVRWETDG